VGGAFIPDGFFIGPQDGVHTGSDNLSLLRNQSSTSWSTRSVTLSLPGAAPNAPASSRCRAERASGLRPRLGRFPHQSSHRAGQNRLRPFICRASSAVTRTIRPRFSAICLPCTDDPTICPHAKCRQPRRPGRGSRQGTGFGFPIVPGAVDDLFTWPSKIPKISTKSTRYLARLLSRFSSSHSNGIAEKVVT